MPNNRSVYFCLLIATLSVFLGRAWQHLYWEVPYRTLFWDQSLMEPLVEFWGSDWNTFTQNIQNDQLIDLWTSRVGGVLIICALLATLLKKIPRIAKIGLISGGSLLFIIAILYSKSKGYNPAQFLEYTLQWGSPFLLLIYSMQFMKRERFILILKIAIVVTFVAHGLYALNVYPRPGHFTQMVISILQVSEQQAIYFLQLAGFMDILLAIALLIPQRRTTLPALLYAAFWGFMTAIARVWANFYWEFPLESLHQWAFECVYRFPHFMIPLATFILLYPTESSQDLSHSDKVIV